MPDDDKRSREFEEARREFDDDAKPSLRVVVPMPKADAWAAPSWLPTGEAVVAEFIRKHGDDFYYIDAEGAFYFWTGKIWQRDECRMVGRLMGELCRTIAAVKSKKSVREKLESAKFIGGAAGRVRDIRAGPLNCFDAAELWCTPDGAIPIVLPLEIREHRREDYCTKMTAVSWGKNQKCPLWLSFLKTITGNDNDMIDYLQRCAGYWSTPLTSEQAFWFLYGSGGNGKGAFLRILKRVLGNYATTASLDLFLATKFEQHTEELASLRGIRLVIATETEKGRSWNETKMKAISGGDAIRARFMRQNSFEYDPNFKVVVSGNHKPSIKSVDAAMRRRLQLVPFDVEIPKSQQDGDFENRMFVQEGPAILAWVFEGYQLWREFGLAAPDRVVKASEEYFVEQDIVGQWIGERCEIGDPNFFDFSSELWRDYQAWAKAGGHYVGTQTSFSLELKKRGFDGPHHGEKGNGFYGIRLKPKEYNE